MAFFSRLLYSTLYSLFVILCGPLYLWRSTGRRQTPIPWLERLGRIPEGLPPPDKSQPRVWIHAVSVGEVNLVAPVVNALSARGIQIYISTTTDTGQALARRRFKEKATIFYFPLDFRWSCRRYLDRIAPRRILIVETEIWPNFIWEASRRKIPVAIINGRISDKSYEKYRRVRSLLQPVLARIDHFCMQSRPDKEKILNLGAPPERVHLVGNLKFDYELASDPQKEEWSRKIGTWLGREKGERIWLCGSTREGEEALLLQVFQELRSRFSELRLVLVPRHPHRVPSVLEEVEQLGLQVRLRSALDDQKAFEQDPPDVLIVDTIGELAYLYGIADIVFVGGSLFPTGGHNVIEAAHFSKPVLFGPYMENFREIAGHFLDSYAALQVESATELAPKLTALLEDPTAGRWLGRNARKVVRDNRGALQRTLEILDIESLVSRSG